MIKTTLLVPTLILLCGCIYINKGPYQVTKPVATGGFVLSSENFSDNGPIPRDFTCDGGNVSPALKWTGVPAGTKSFILTLKDPDAVNGNFLHWAVVDIPLTVPGIDRNSKFPPNSRELRNDAGISGYAGPCPPSGRHRYVFSLFAVNSARFNDDPATLGEFLKVHAIAKTTLTGLYKR